MTQFFFGWITCGVSFITLSGVCIDRLLALTLHLRYETVVTLPRVIKVVIVVWVVCSVWTFSKFWFGDKWIILPALIALVTVLITAFCTLKIFKTARKHQRHINEQNHATFVSNKCAVDALKCKKSAVTVLYIYGFLVIWYLPFLAAMVVKAISGVDRSVKVVYDLTTAVVFINSSANIISFIAGDWSKYVAPLNIIFLLLNKLSLQLLVTHVLTLVTAVWATRSRGTGGGISAAVKKHCLRPLIGRKMFLTRESVVCSLWLARIYLRTKLYDLVFQWVCLSM